MGVLTRPPDDADATLSLTISHSGVYFVLAFDMQLSGDLFKVDIEIQLL